MLWPSLSAGASLLEQATNPNLLIAPAPFAEEPAQENYDIMACWGEKRQQISRTIPIHRPNNPAPPVNVNCAAGPPRTMAFQCRGETALTAVGAIWGRCYRFNHPGAILEDDPRDRASLATTPNFASSLSLRSLVAKSSSAQAAAELAFRDPSLRLSNREFRLVDALRELPLAKRQYFSISNFRSRNGRSTPITEQTPRARFPDSFHASEERIVGYSSLGGVW